LEQIENINKEDINKENIMENTGIVQSVSGVVKAVALDGTERLLSVGDRVEFNEQVITDALSDVVILFSDGTTINIGGETSITLNDESISSSQALADAQSEVAEIQAALDSNNNFDPTTLPATAAGTPGAGGAGGAGDAGSSFVNLEHDAPEAAPTSGFDTEGLELAFSEEIQESGIIDSVPTAGTITVLLDEDDLGGSDAELADDLEVEFEAAIGLNSSVADARGVNDEKQGDDLAPFSPTVLTGALVADFGLDGPGDIVFNPADTQPNGLSSGGNAIQYYVSADGHSLVGYIIEETVTGQGGLASTEAEVIFSASLTDVNAGEFRVVLYGSLDHPDGSTEDNLLIDLGFTISDIDGDTASGVLQLDIDDDAPVIITPESSSVDEEGLADGNVGDSYLDGGDIVGAALIANGDLNILWGADDTNDDGGSVDRSVSFAAQDAPVDLSSNGEGVAYSISADGQTLTAYTGSDTAVEANWVFTVELSDLESGSYSFELLSNLDHDVVNTEDDIDLNFAFTATDSDGDEASGSFTVAVDDDGPVITLGESADWTGVSVTGDVVDAVSFGADGEGSIDFTFDTSDISITGVLQSNGEDISFVARDTNSDGHNDQIVGSTTDGDVLTIDGVLDGDYEVSILGPIDDNADIANALIEAHVSAVDGDGDIANAVLTINIAVDMNQVLAATIEP